MKKPSGRFSESVFFYAYLRVGEHTRPRVLFPAPSPETGRNHLALGFHESAPYKAPPNREGALRSTRRRVRSPLGMLRNYPPIDIETMAS